MKEIQNRYREMKAIELLRELTEAASSNPSDETPRLTAAIVAAQKFLTDQPEVGQ